jgi:hypothetical protein
MRTILFLGALVVLVFVLAKNVRAQTECDDVYGLCMAGCANDRSAERCMQRCQGARNRCSLSGSFGTQSAGFLGGAVLLDQSTRRELYDRPPHDRRRNTRE